MSLRPRAAAAFVRTIWVQVGSLLVMVLLTWLLPKHAREPGAEPAAVAPEPLAEPVG